MLFSSGYKLCNGNIRLISKIIAAYKCEYKVGKLSILWTSYLNTFIK